MRLEHWLLTIPLRLRSLFHRSRVDEELDEELQHHVELKTREYVAKGMAPEEARYAALREFGGLEQAKEQCRETRKVAWLQNLAQDLRYGFRMLRRFPGFTVVAVLTLALGIGGNAAIFSLVNGVLLRPLPYRDPGRLTIVSEKDDRGRPNNATFATYTDWKRMSTSFEDLALYRSWAPTLTGSGEPEELAGLRVTSNYFRTLGIRPELGRDFRPEEDTPSTRHVVMLSHGLWVRRFNADRDVIGKTFTFGSQGFMVVGVLPQEFQSLISMDPRAGTVEIFGPLGYDASQPWACRTCHHLMAIGRLRPGVTFAQANAQMDTISAALWKEYPKDYSAAGVILTPLSDQLLGPVRKTLYLLLGAVTFVLLIACANLANLLLARATRRDREIAVRMALGAARGRIVRQLLAENCLLALLGAAVGLVPAYWAPKLVAALGASDLPRLGEARLDWRVLLFTIGIALLTGILAGMSPAFRLSDPSLHDALKEGARGSSAGAGSRLRAALVVCEIALSLTLLLGAGLLLRSLTRLLTVAPGFDASQVLTMKISMIGKKYDDDKNLRQSFVQALERIRALPGVEAAGVASEIPLGGNMDRYGFHVEGKINANPELDPSAERYCVSPGYRASMGIPLLRGRDLADSDVTGGPQVLLISESAAREIWPGEDALGKHVKLGGTDKPWWTVVGVVGDVHQYGLDVAPGPQFYVPHAQWPFPDSNLTFTIRTAGPPGAMAEPVQRVLRSLDSSQPISRVMPLGDYIGLSVQSRRFSLILLGAFAVIAVMLAMVGVYGVTAYMVAQRTREIGIRMTFGAQQSQVLALLLRQWLVLVCAGVALGAALSAALMRFLTSMLFGIRPSDPATLVLVSALLAVVAVLACWVPARRAMCVDPVVALRHE